MVRKRRLGLANPKGAFEALEPYRSRLCLMASEYDPNGEEYRVIRHAVEALDDATERLTGKRDLLWLKPHSSSGRPGWVADGWTVAPLDPTSSRSTIGSP